MLHFIRMHGARHHQRSRSFRLCTRLFCPRISPSIYPSFNPAHSWRNRDRISQDPVLSRSGWDWTRILNRILVVSVFKIPSWEVTILSRVFSNPAQDQLDEGSFRILTGFNQALNQDYPGPKHSIGYYRILFIPIGSGQNESESSLSESDRNFGLLPMVGSTRKFRSDSDNEDSDSFRPDPIGMKRIRLFPIGIRSN